MIDIRVDLPEIIAIQRDTNKNTDETVKTMANMEMKMDSIEGQLMHVNQTVQSLQNKLGLLIEKMTK